MCYRLLRFAAESALHVTLPSSSCLFTLVGSCIEHLLVQLIDTGNHVWWTGLPLKPVKKPVTQLGVTDRGDQLPWPTLTSHVLLLFLLSSLQLLFDICTKFSFIPSSCPYFKASLTIEQCPSFYWTVFKLAHQLHGWILVLEQVKCTFDLNRLVLGFDGTQTLSSALPCKMI